MVLGLELVFLGEGDMEAIGDRAGWTIKMFSSVKRFTQRSEVAGCERGAGEIGAAPFGPKPASAKRWKHEHYVPPAGYGADVAAHPYSDLGRIGPKPN
jgi:hypothetical protein